MRTELDRRTLLLALAALGTGSPALARGDDDRSHRKRSSRHDHEQARRALEEGRARPLADILAEVRPRLGGEVIDVEFEREDGRYVYEFKVITPAGQLREIEVDALTAEILKDEAD
ncbi:MAG TPA: PepSY domain-containing protein [Hyphomicrobiaceae bacterium]|jgi:uncharacterized membrane protein YkoI